jgi:hypothetical protein
MRTTSRYSSRSVEMFSCFFFKAILKPCHDTLWIQMVLAYASMVSVFSFPVCYQDEETKGQNSKSLLSIQVKKTIGYSKGFFRL